jgi:hypothetical protein
MLFGETVAVYCENHSEHTDTLLWPECRVLIYTNLVCTSQETHYVSAAKPNRLMLFRETVAVYCENHIEHTDTLCGQIAEFWYVNPDRTSQETHYVSATKPNLLMLSSPKAVQCEYLGAAFMVYRKGELHVWYMSERIMIHCINRQIIFLICSKPSLIRLQLIRIEIWKMNNSVYRWVHTLKDTCDLGRQMSHSVRWLTAQRETEHTLNCLACCSVSLCDSESGGCCCLYRFICVFH